MQIKLHSMYEHFPSYKFTNENEPFIECYNDFYVKHAKGNGKEIALLVEPRSIQPDIYKLIEKCYHKFAFIFTHDSEILKKCDNAKPFIWGSIQTYGGDFPHISKKTKNISFVSSDKEMCDLHIVRKRLAYELNGKVDCYGTYNGGDFVTPETALKDYKFSVIMENYIDDLWLTEKVINCISWGTIPIYYGARNIDKYFNREGIIQCNSVDEIKMWVDRLQDTQVSNQEYSDRLFYAMCNRLIALEDFYSFERNFMREYEKTLCDLWEERK